MTRPNGHLWKISEIYEVNNFMSGKAWILMKRSVVKEKCRNPVPFKWVFNCKEDSGVLIFLKSVNVVKGCIQVPGVVLT